MTDKYRHAAQAAVDELLRSRPEWATTLGDHRFDHLVDDLSEHGLAETSRRLWAHRAELAGIYPGELDVEDRVDLAMLLNELDYQSFLINDLACWRWDPLIYNPGEALYPLVSRDVLPLPDRLRAISSRLELFAERLSVAARQLDAPPRAHIETALQQHAGTVALVDEEISRLLQADAGLRAVVQPAQERALESLGKYEAALRELLEGPHRPERIGADLFGRRLALALCSELAPEAVFERAHNWMGEVRHNLQVAARQYLGGGAGMGDEEVVQEALAKVAHDHPNDKTLLNGISSALERCTMAVKALGVVSLPDQPMRVELMPVFRRGVAGAYCDPAGPLEEGGETSFAVAPTPDEWTKEQKLSFYREYNDAMIVNLTVHEAMPGHMVQLAHARRFEGSTVARKVLASGTFVEGWAVHAERIMAEHGNGGLPVRLQQLKMQLRVAANALLDVSFHAGELDEAAAMELMCGSAYQEPSEARNKWRRVKLSSAQLSTYFVGYTELSELFAKTGELEHYDDVLAHGSPPPRLLGQLMGGEGRS